jgi:hypothetical protein
MPLIDEPVVFFARTEALELYLVAFLLGVLD